MTNQTAIHLLEEDQFSCSCNAQPVGIAGVFNPDLPLTLEQVRGMNQSDFARRNFRIRLIVNPLTKHWLRHDRVH